MSELERFTQPDITLTIDQTSNANYTASVRRPGRNRPYDVPFPSDITFESIQARVVTFRDQLTKWSKQYNSLLDAGKADGIYCDPQNVRPLWDDLAKFGSELYSELFNVLKPGTPAARLAETIKKLPEGSQISIDAPRLVIPWGFLYEGDLPEAGDKDYLENYLKCFWGFRYEIDLQPPYSDGDYDARDFINLRPYLDNSTATRLTASINRKADSDKQQVSFFSKLREQFASSSDSNVLSEINYSRDTVIKSMIEREEPHHLFYFFCHHTKGEGVTLVYGNKDYKEETRIMMDGETGGVIKLKELKELTRKRELVNFKDPPLIFLNACDSGQLEMGDPSGFMEYFVHDLNSFDYIGTHANVPARFANDYGQRFLKEFFSGKGVGSILRDLGRLYAGAYCNPFGLYYNLFGLAQLKLSKKLEAIIS